MKVDLKSKKKEFEPIEVTITIESEEELDTLIARLSVICEVINNELDNHTYNPPVYARATPNKTLGLFKELYKLKHSQD